MSEREIMSNLKFSDSNIEEMEKHKSLYCRDYPKADIWVANFMENVIDECKDLHEENTRLWKAIAELLKKEEIDDPDQH